MLFLLNLDWFDLIRAIYSSVSCPNFCCHSCTTLIKVAWIRVRKISKHNMKELRKSKKWHETFKCSNEFKKTQNKLKQIESCSGYFFTYKTLFGFRNLLELCYSTTTWTNFDPILNPSPPRVDKRGLLHTKWAKKCPPPPHKIFD